MGTQQTFLQEGILEGVGGHLEGQSPGVWNPGLCSVTLLLYFLLDQGKRPPNRCRSLWAELLEPAVGPEGSREEGTLVLQPRGAHSLRRWGHCAGSLRLLGPCHTGAPRSPSGS